MVNDNMQCGVVVQNPLCVGAKITGPVLFINHTYNIKFYFIPVPVEVLEIYIIIKLQRSHI